MSFQTTLQKLTKANLVQVAVSHIGYVDKMLKSITSALEDADKQADDVSKYTFLATALTNLMDPDLLTQWLDESKALLQYDESKPVQMGTASTAATTSAITAKLPASLSKLTSTASVKKSASADDSGSDFESGMSFQNRPIAYKLPPNVPMFMADGRTCEEWFFVFQTSSIPKTVILPILSTFLKGTALHLLKNFMESGQTEWLDFKDLLRQTFLPRDHDYRLRVQLTKLVQNNESIDNYNRKFLAISTQLIGLTMTDRLFHYTTGLNDKTKYEVMSKQPKSLDEALAIATQFEHINNRTQIADINVATVKTHRNFNRPQQSKNINRSLPQKGKPPVICYKCNRTGHYSNDCRATASSSPQNVHQNTQNFRNHKRPSYGKPPTSYKQAMTFTRSDVDTLLKVEGSITGSNCGSVPLLCTLDSAASISMMSEATALKHGFEIMQSDIHIKSANNAVTAVVGSTDLVTIDIHGHSCQLKLVILDHDDHEVLLGLDWFMATGASLHPRSFTIRFPGSIIPLHTSNISSGCDNEDDADEHAILSANIADEDDIAGDVDWHTTNTIDMQPVAKLNEPDQKAFNQLAVSANKSFATDYNSLGCCNISKHEIRLQTRIPIHSHAYRKSLRERDLLKDEINKLLTANIIRPSRSPYASPVILVPKKDGSVRMCVDYRRLNLETIPEQWPLPRITDILDNMLGSKWFSTLDLKSGYYQVAMSPSSIEKTAFVTPDGHFEFLRLPFGLKNAPAHFSKIMYQALGDLNFVKIYLDDITIHSKTFPLHVEHVSKVIGRLKEANLKLNGEKCAWFAQEISLLGHIVNTDGISMDPKKVHAIQAMLPPTTVKQVQQFLGICNYYRRFIADFAKISQPIAELVKLDTPFIWSPQCQSAFVLLKSLLLEFPILRQPDHNRTFLVYTDASGYALGAILSQKDDNDNEYVCQYASRLLKGAELHYGITEKECLAVVWAIRQFRTYVHGVHFIVITDHSALVWLMSIRDPTGKLARWAIYLQSYDYEIKHRRGRIHSNVDTLSRPVLIAATTSLSNHPCVVLNIDPLEDEALLHYLKFGRHLPGTSERKCKNVLSKISNFKFEDQKLWYRKNVGNNIYVEVPERSLRHDIVTHEHLLGHFYSLSPFQIISRQSYV